MIHLIIGRQVMVSSFVVHDSTPGNRQEKVVQSLTQCNRHFGHVNADVLQLIVGQGAIGDTVSVSKSGQCHVSAVTSVSRTRKQIVQDRFGVVTNQM